MDVLMEDLDFAIDPVTDLEERLAVLRATGERILPVKWNGKKAWVVLKYKDVSVLLGDEVNLPAWPEYKLNWDLQGSSPLMMKGAAHRASRAVLEGPFKIGEVRRRVGTVLVPLADKLIDEFGDRREVDLIADFCRRYTFLVIADILGIEVTKDRAEENELVRLLYTLLQGFPDGETTPEQRRAAALEAVDAVNEYLRPTIEARRADPKEDMISFLVHAEEGGAPMSETRLYDYVRFLFPAGAETTHSAMGKMMKNVLSDLSTRDRLIAHPEERGAAVEESLRIATASTLVPRTLLDDTTICDVDIPGGSTVLLAVASANQDEAVFTNSAEYSLDHKRKPVLSFGAGVHHCLGHHLARAEMQTALSRLLDRLPGLRLAETAPPPIGTVVRWLPELKVRFDDIVPAPES